MTIPRPTAPRFQLLRQVSYALRAMKEMRGQFDRECTLCGYYGRFLPAGRPPRYDAKCPNCLSVERHRLVALTNQRASIIGSQDSVLHFAPEPALGSYLRAVAGAYRSADLEPGRAELVLNAESIDLEDSSFDVIVVSHVLEHVDDGAALQEFARVLRPGGRLIAMFPIVETWERTYERSDISSEKDRLLHFGQEDHVRYYGRDARDRIRSAGLRLTEFTALPEDCARFGLSRGETLFIGTAS